MIQQNDSQLLKKLSLFKIALKLVIGWNRLIIHKMHWTVVVYRTLLFAKEEKELIQNFVIELLQFSNAQRLATLKPVQATEATNIPEKPS